MKKITLIIITFLSFVLVVTSCACGRGAVTQQNDIRYDSVYIEKKQVLRDTTLVTPRANITFKQPLNDFQTAFKTPVIKQNKQAKVRLQIIRDTLHVQAECDTLTYHATLKDSFYSAAKTKIQIKEVIKEIPVKYTPKLMRYFAWLGMFCLGALIGYLGLKIFKLKIPFL